MNWKILNKILNHPIKNCEYKKIKTFFDVIKNTVIKIKIF